MFKNFKKGFAKLMPLFMIAIMVSGLFIFMAVQTPTVEPVYAAAPTGSSATIQNSTSTTVDVVLTGTDFHHFTSSGIATADSTDLLGITYDSVNPTAAIATGADGAGIITATFPIAIGTDKSGGSFTVDASMVQDSVNTNNLLITILDGSITDSAKPVVTAVVTTVASSRNVVNMTYSENVTVSTGDGASSTATGDLTSAGTITGFGTFATVGAVTVPTTLNSISGSGTSTIVITLANEAAGYINTGSATVPSGVFTPAAHANVTDGTNQVNTVATPTSSAGTAWTLTQPTITSVTVDDAAADNGKIDQAVVVFSVAVRDANITNGDATLGSSGTTTGTFTTGSADDATTTFDRTDDNTVDTSTAAGDFLYSGATTLITDLYGNLLNTATDGQIATGDIAETDGASPVLLTWALNLSAPTLTMNFSESVDVATPLDVTKITIQDAATSTTTYVLTNSTTASANGTAIVIDLSVADLAAIQADVGLATDINNSYLIMTAATIDDLAGNAVTAIANTAGVKASTYAAGAAGALTLTDVALSSYWINGDVAATITFTNERIIPSDGIIEIVFPTGYILTGVNNATSPDSSIDGTLTVVVVGQTVTITRSLGTNTSALTAATLVITTVKNPSTAGITGTYTFQTQTSAAAVIDENTVVAGDTIVDPTTTTPTPTTPTGGGGGGGGGGQTSNDSNTTTSSIASNIDTVNADQTYSRPVQFTEDTMVINTDDNTVTVQATGDDGTLTIKPNSQSTISLAIPSDTTITADASWSGRIEPPLIRSLTNIHASGEVIEGTDDLLIRSNVAALVEVSDGTLLSLSNDSTLTIPVDLPDGSVVNVYSSDNETTWDAQGTAVVQNDQVVIMTDRLTYFALEMTDETAELVEALGEAEAFEDIAGHWAESYINTIADLGIVSGKTETTFAPDDNITRAELTKIVMKAFAYSVDPIVGDTGFGDVSSSAWYAPYIVAARNAGIIQGYEGNIFSPNGLINRAEALKILIGGAGFVGVEENYNTNYANQEEYTVVFFPDVTIGEWFAMYVAYAKDYDIVGGYADGTFGPGNFITRAEVAKIVTKILEMQ
jgi:hypothetical protein